MHRVEHVMGMPIVVAVRDGDDRSAVDEVLMRGPDDPRRRPCAGDAGLFGLIQIRPY